MVYFLLTVSQIWKCFHCGFVSPIDVGSREAFFSRKKRKRTRRLSLKSWQSPSACQAGYGGQEWVNLFAINERENWNSCGTTTSNVSANKNTDGLCDPLHVKLFPRQCRANKVGELLLIGQHLYLGPGVLNNRFLWSINAREQWANKSRSRVMDELHYVDNLYIHRREVHTRPRITSAIIPLNPLLQPVSARIPSTDLSHQGSAFTSDKKYSRSLTFFFQHTLQHCHCYTIPAVQMPEDPFPRAGWIFSFCVEVEVTKVVFWSASVDWDRFAEM